MALIDENGIEHFQVVYSQEVSEKIERIYQSTLELTMSQQSARNAISKILAGGDDLEIFPERGFDVDEKLGTQIHAFYKTRGLVAGKYILFYQILSEEEQGQRRKVFISHLISTKSDWVDYFG